MTTHVKKSSTPVGKTLLYLFLLFFDPRRVQAQSDSNSVEEKFLRGFEKRELKRNSSIPASDGLEPTYTLNVSGSVKHPSDVPNTFMPEILCPSDMTEYTTKEGDDGKSIAFMFYPELDPTEAWSVFITCNQDLQLLYSNSTSVTWDVPMNLTLHVPNISQTISLFSKYYSQVLESEGLPADENCGCTANFPLQNSMKITKLGKAYLTYLNEKDNKHQKGFVTAELLRCNPNVLIRGSKIMKGQTLQGICMDMKSIDIKSMNSSSFDVKTNITLTSNAPKNGQRDLAADGSSDCRSKQGYQPQWSGIPSYPDCYLDRSTANGYPYNWWQCVASYSYETIGTVRIVTGGNDFCREQWQRYDDGCSSPVWSAYTNTFQAACHKHDACYWLSYRAGYSESVATRLGCDSNFFYDMSTVCSQMHCNEWWKNLPWSECHWCYDTRNVWSIFLGLAQINKPTTPIRNHPGSLYSVWTRPGKLPWYFEFVTRFREGRGVVRSVMNGKCLDGQRKQPLTDLIMWDCHGGDNQMFEENYGRLKLSGTNLCLDARNGNAGQRVYLYECHGGWNQQWIYDDQQRLRLKQNINLCLDIAWADWNNGAAVQIVGCHDHDAQRWSM